jgi:hypothetical protein
VCDLGCGCRGGELSWTKPEVLAVAPKKASAIFTCPVCHCVYDTSAKRTCNCSEFRSAEKMSDGNSNAEDSGRVGFWQLEIKNAEEMNTGIKCSSSLFAGLNI